MPKSAALVVFLSLAAQCVCADELRLNQLQVIGTHNSYHLAPDPEMRKLLAAINRNADAWDYTREPLDAQLGKGIRQFELDVYADPEGGLFARPDDPQDSPMRMPGIKVLHVPGVDMRSNHPTFTGALEAVRDWSLAHPRHVPVMILVELKDSADNPAWPRPARFDRAQMDSLEREILTVFERGHLLAPDDVRGSRATLREAVVEDGWPALASVLGRVLFCLDNEGWHRDAYLRGNASLEGRLLFASVDRDHPAAAWMKRNDPEGGFEDIRALVRAGFLVRTRADANTAQARANDTTRRERALASGAQFVSTDYPEPDARLSGYRVRLPAGVVARPNPVSAPGAAAVDGDLESLAVPAD